MTIEEQCYINTNDINSEEPLLINIEQACKLMHLGRNTMLKFTKIKGFPALILPRKNTNR